tara:strand:+ start:10341 stop:10544 length:204 start_codon:yes stop_codon:yes gene_type:complete
MEFMVEMESPFLNLSLSEPSGVNIWSNPSIVTTKADIFFWQIAVFDYLTRHRCTVTHQAIDANLLDV